MMMENFQDKIQEYIRD